MYTTYHEAIAKPDDVTSTIPHAVLADEIKAELQQWSVKEAAYFYDWNGYYFFLYLSNGDRIDVKLT